MCTLFSGRVLQVLDYVESFLLPGYTDSYHGHLGHPVVTLFLALILREKISLFIVKNRATTLCQCRAVEIYAVR